MFFVFPIIKNNLSGDAHFIKIQTKNKRDNYQPDISVSKKKDFSFFIESIYTDGIDMLDNNDFANFNLFACIQIEKIANIFCQNKNVLPIYPKYFFKELENIDKQLAIYIKELITMKYDDKNKKEIWDQICIEGAWERRHQDIRIM